MKKTQIKKSRQQDVGGKRCVVGGCSNTARDGFSIYTMSKRQEKWWSNFILTTRSDFKAKHYINVHVCSAHFTLDQFDQSQLMMCRQGFRKNPPALKDDAIPTIKSGLKCPNFFNQPETSDEGWDVDSIKTVASDIREGIKAAQAKPSSAHGPTFHICHECGAHVSCNGNANGANSTVSPATVTSESPSTKDPPSTSASAATSIATLTAGPLPSSASSGDEAGERPKKMRRMSEAGLSKYQYQKELRDIQEEYDKEAAEEKAREREAALAEPVDISQLGENDKTDQFAPLMVHREVGTRVKEVSCGVQVNSKHFSKTKGTQIAVVNLADQQAQQGRTVHHVSSQTDQQKTEKEPQQPEREEIADEEDHYFEPEDVEKEDPTWQPQDDSSGSSSDESCFSEPEQILLYDNPVPEPKFIVFESKLMELFLYCPKCSGPCDREKFRPRSFGSELKIKQTCQCCEYERSWYSQPKVGHLPAGNIILSAAILFAGASPTQTLKVFNHMNLVSISNETYLNHQKLYLQPAIIEVWRRQQRHTLLKLQTEERVVLGGDGRADSPGHCAKYGSYSLMDLNSGKIVAVELVQSNEVTSSNAMELEGLKRAMTKLTDAGVKVSRLVTDRHSSVQKYMKDTHKKVDHRYDVWHIAKGIKKNVKAVANTKGCEEAGLWQRSIINHVYWSASSTTDGNGEVIQTKYKSVLSHMTNVHTGHGHEEYDECAHGPLDKPRVWLKTDSKVYDRLSEVLLKTRLLNDIKKMSPGEQTSSLEAYHSTLLYWCPKLLAFSYEGMKCRLFVSAMHWNENGGRAQATKTDGTPIYKVNFPKSKPNGAATLSKVLTAPTYNYVDELMARTMKEAKAGEKDRRQQLPELAAPPALCARFDHPDKAVMIEAHKQHSRFVRKDAN